MAPRRQPLIPGWLYPGLAATALMVADVGGVYADLIRQWWNQLVEWVRGLFA